MRKNLLLLLGAGAAGVAGYLLDPREGARRRADLLERVQGLVPPHLMEKVINSQLPQVPDSEVLGSVQAALEQSATRPRAIEVQVEHGVVHLCGVIPTDELETLVRRLSHLPGVRRIDCKLQAYGEPLLPEDQG
ncbi:MAG: BON domain-containing protein [Candidatus Xenobia bacterium]